MTPCVAGPAASLCTISGETRPARRVRSSCFFIGIARFITVVIAWFAILFTGSYAGGLYRVAVGYLCWSFRVESYLLLTRDEYPPVSFET